MQLVHFNENHDPKTGRFTFSNKDTVKSRTDNYARVINRLSDDEYRLFADGGQDRKADIKWTKQFAKYQVNHKDTSVFISKYGNVTLASLDYHPVFGNQWHIGWATDPKYRGTGITQKNIKEAVEFIRKFSDVPITAIIDPDNIPSRRTAEKAGFKEVGEVYNPNQNKTDIKYVYN